MSVWRRMAGLDEPQLRYLGSAEQLEERGAPRLARLAAGVGGLFVVAAVGWAAVTSVTEMAPSTGQVIPAGAVRVVQHLEGGILAELHVREGDRVAEGQVLATLAEAGVQSDLDQLKAREAALSHKVERLKAFAEDRELSFDATIQGYPALADDQSAIFRQARGSRAAQRQVQLLTIQERESELKVLQSQQAGLKQQIALATETVSLREGLVEKGLSSRLTFLDVKRELARLTGELAANQGNVVRARDQIATATQRLAELDTKLANEAMTEMGAAASELVQVREQLKKQTDRVTRLTVAAPVGGVVKAIKVKTLGGVLPAGQAFAEIVPLGEELVAETRIQPKDVGNLRPGQPAYVRVTAFDATRFGGIDGEVRHISASTFDDGDGKPYYKAVIALGQSHVGSDPSRNVVMPGMTVQADVRTGSRTVLEYLAKPVKSALANAMHER
jgi:membrane fusion protein, adhesin transport system